MPLRSRSAKRFSLAMVMVGALLLGACNSASSTCSAPGRCENDVVFTDAQVQSCLDEIKDPACGAAFEAYESCVEEREACSPSGDEDEAATVAACADTQASLEGCCQANPAAAPCAAPCVPGFADGGC